MSTIPIALWVALIGVIYFVGGLAIFLLRQHLTQPFTDLELVNRKSSPLLGESLRIYWAWITRPVWKLVQITGIPADALTSLSLLLALVAGFVLAFGHLSLGGLLFIGVGILDFLDGRVARARGETSIRGAALDSILDRLADSAVLVGLAWYFRDTPVLAAILWTIVGTQTISYIRAKGESLGVSVKVGLMQRPERIAILSAALVLTPIFDIFLVLPGLPHSLLSLVLIFLALATMATTLHRLVFLLRNLENPQAKSIRKRVLGRNSVLRSLASAFFATAIDFLAVLALVQLLGLDPWLATAAGCTVGGVVNFSIGRLWAFHSHGEVHDQAWRYLLVSASSAVLNAGGVAALTLGFIPYQLAWLIVRTLVFLGWNFPLHRDYVFNARSQQLSCQENSLRDGYDLGGRKCR